MGHKNCTLLLLAVWATTSACSGGGETSDFSGSTTVGPVANQPTPAERQARACEQVSAGIVRCDAQFANAPDSEEQRATLARQCQSATLDPRTVAAYERCASGPQTCAPLMSCLDAARKGEVLLRLRARQSSACQRASKIVTRCAESTMPQEEIAKRGAVTDEQRQRHSEEYRDDCQASEMSQRQIAVLESCLQVSSCDAFVKCTDRAQPRR